MQIKNHIVIAIHPEKKISTDLPVCGNTTRIYHHKAFDQQLLALSSSLGIVHNISTDEDPNILKGFRQQIHVVSKKLYSYHIHHTNLQRSQIKTYQFNFVEASRKFIMHEIKLILMFTMMKNLQGI